MSFPRRNVTSVEDIDKYFSNARRFRLRGEPPKDVREVLRRLAFASEGTVYPRGGKHCATGRSRSIVDLVIVTKYYFPETTYSDVVRNIINEYLDKMANNERGLYILYCPTISKYNFRRGWNMTLSSISSLFITLSGIGRDLHDLFTELEPKEGELFFKNLFVEEIKKRGLEMPDPQIR